MSIRWSLSMLERELNRLYDEVLALENLSLLRAEQGKIETMFLSEADRYFQVNYSMSGHKLVYTYYFLGTLFAEINLWECPEFEEREKFIQWFVEQIRTGRENLKLPS